MFNPAVLPNTTDASLLTTYRDLVFEYVALSSSGFLADSQAERFSEILTQAQEEPALCFWLDEIDCVLASKLDLATESLVKQQQGALEKSLSGIRSSYGLDQHSDIQCHSGIEPGRIDDLNNEHESVSIDLSASELEVLNELSQKKEMSQSAIIRQALRVLGFIEERIGQGETFFFESPSKEKVEVFL